MKKIFLLLLLLLASCSGEVEVGEDVPVEDLDSVSEEDGQGLLEESLSLKEAYAFEAFELDFEGQAYRLQTGECESEVTSQPLLVGNFLVFSFHERGLQCEHSQKMATAETLYAYALKTGELKQIDSPGAMEGMPAYAEDKHLLMVPVVDSRGFVLYDTRTFARIAEGNLGASVDSRILYLDGYFYLGTVNTPFPTCQEPLDEDCGAVFKVDSKGRVVQRLDLSEGFRAWVTAGPSTDGDFIYLGTGSSHGGSFYDCNVLKLSKDLAILRAFDPDTKGCVPSGPRLENAVGNEVVVTDEGLWVQWLASTKQQVANLNYLDKNLNVVCEMTLQDGPSSHFYMNPAVDEEGNAYVVLNDYVNGDAGALFKVSSDCEVLWSYALQGSALSGPTLVADEVWVATGETVVALSLDGQRRFEQELPSARGYASPYVWDDGVLLLGYDWSVLALKAH